MKLPLSCALVAAVLLTACGQAGDLYLPDNPPPAVRKREEDRKKRAQEQDKQAQQQEQEQEQPPQAPKPEPQAPAPQPSQEQN